MLTYIHNFRPSVTAGRWYYFWVRHMWFVCLWVHHLLKTFCSHRRHMQRIRDFLVIVGSTSLLFTFFTFTKLVRSTLSKDESVSWPYGLLWERTKCQILGRGMPTVTLTADFLATLEITFFCWLPTFHQTMNQESSQTAF